METQTIEDMGVYQNVVGYVEGIKEHLLTTLKADRSVDDRRQLLREPARSATV